MLTVERGFAGTLLMKCTFTTIIVHIHLVKTQENNIFSNLKMCIRVIFKFIKEITLYPASTLLKANVPITSSASTPGTYHSIIE